MEGGCGLYHSHMCRVGVVYITVTCVGYVCVGLLKRVVTLLGLLAPDQQNSCCHQNQGPL